MGGGPTIAGGMNEMQYRQLQMEERQFMADQENRQMKLMQDMEDKRLQREQAEMQRQEGLREAEEEALRKLESGISEEITNIGDDDKEEDKDLVMDFYGSLAQGGKPNETASPKGIKTDKAGGRPK